MIIPLNRHRRRRVATIRRRSRASGRFVLFSAFYTAGIIMGAGMLTLPALTATIGLVPAIVLTLLLGIGLTYVYGRTTAAVREAVRTHSAEALRGARPITRYLGFGPKEDALLEQEVVRSVLARKEAGILDATCAWLGFGLAGKIAITLGLIAYVVPALVVYVLAGAKALSAIAARLVAAGVSPATTGVVAVVGGGASLVAPRLLTRFTGRAAVCSFLQMVASWLGGIAVLMAMPDQPWLPPLLFAAALVGLVLQAVPIEGGGRIEDEGTLLPTHQIGTAITGINLALLAITAVIALVLLRLDNRLANPRLFGSLDRGDWSHALGALIFAFTGTGLFNLLKYRRFSRDTQRGRQSDLARAVALGTIIPTVAFVGWMVAIAFVVAPAMLQETDRTGGYATVPLAELLTHHGPVGWVVFVTGYAVALLAVTGSGLGFSESLADRAARVWRDANPFRAQDSKDKIDPALVRKVQVVLIVLAATIVIAVQAGGALVTVTAVLSCAGYAGGGLIILVIPFFIAASGQRATGRDVAIATLITAVIAVLSMQDMPAGAAKYIFIAINVSFVVGYLVLLGGWLRSRRRTADAPAVIPSGSTPQPN